MHVRVRSKRKNNKHSVRTSTAQVQQGNKHNGAAQFGKQRDGVTGVRLVLGWPEEGSQRSGGAIEMRAMRMPEKRREWRGME